MTFFSNWIIFFPLAFSLFVGMRLAGGSRDEVQRSIPALILRLIMFLFFFLAFMSVGLRSSLLSIVWGLIIVGFFVVLFFKNRRLERSALLYTLLNAVTHSQRQMIAENFALSNLGYLRRRARKLCWQFNNSINWGLSLEICGVAKSRYECLGVRLQARYGKLAHVGSAQLIEQQNTVVIEQELERTIGRMAIFSWVILLFPLFAVFMAILPTFKSLIEEMGMGMPPIMELVFSASGDFSRLGWSSLLSLLPPVFIMIVGIGILFRLFPQLTRLPIIRILFNDYYRSLGFVAFRSACEKEANLTQACFATAELVPVDFIAARYRQAAHLLQQGQLPSSAFATAGVFNRREATTLAWGLDSNNPVWGLQQLASWKIERMLQRISTLVQWSIVVLTVLLGIIVGIFAAGIMQTLSMMILQLDSFQN